MVSVLARPAAGKTGESCEFSAAIRGTWASVSGDMAWCVALDAGLIGVGAAVLEAPIKFTAEHEGREMSAHGKG